MIVLKILGIVGLSILGLIVLALALLGLHFLIQFKEGIF